MGITITPEKWADIVKARNGFSDTDLARIYDIPVIYIREILDGHDDMRGATKKIKYKPKLKFAA